MLVGDDLDKEKKNLSFSLVLVPHSGSNSRTIKITHRTIVKLLCVVGVCLLCILVSLARFIYVNNQLVSHQQNVAQLEVLTKENQQQKAKLDELNKEAEQMRQKMDSLNSLAAKISSMLKLKSPEPSRGSVPAGMTNFTDLSTRAEVQQQVFTSYMASVENYSEYLKHRPSMLPKQGSISSAYGTRSNPFGGRSTEFHDGIDIEANYGDPVRATADGVVSFVGWDGGYGHKVEINHGYGIRTFYGHNSSLKVQVGQKVKKGDVIALAGSSGRSTGVHIHWGASLYGQSVNPLDFLNKNKL
jgi:murein DD-endopeptidase MepM/ murein hydrolase activator NlpD